MKLSIVIPIYNVEKYLQQCLESCLRQNIDAEKYEIIIVNDGSTDKSFDIAKSYESLSNVRIITQKNAGLSAARNTGLKIAKGEYVWFIDSDDWIELGILEHILKELSLNKLECLRLNYRKTTDDGRKLEDCILANSCNEFCKEGMEFLQKELGFSFYAWSFVFNRSFLLKNGFLFAEGLVFEDLQLIPRILRKVKYIKVLPSVAYNYRQRKGSIVNTVNEKMLNSVFNILKSYQIFIMSINDKREKDYFILLLNRIKIMFLVLLGNFGNNTKKRCYMHDFQELYPSIKILFGMSLKEKICGFIYNFSPQLLYWLLNMKYLLK